LDDQMHARNVARAGADNDTAYGIATDDGLAGTQWMFPALIVDDAVRRTITEGEQVLGQLEVEFAIRQRVDDYGFAFRQPGEGLLAEIERCVERDRIEDARFLEHVARLFRYRIGRFRHRFSAFRAAPVAGLDLVGLFDD